MFERATFEFEELSLYAQEGLDDELYDHSGVFEAMAKNLQVYPLTAATDSACRQGVREI